MKEWDINKRESKRMIKLIEICGTMIIVSLAIAIVIIIGACAIKQAKDILKIKEKNND